VLHDLRVNMYLCAHTHTNITPIHKFAQTKCTQVHIHTRPRAQKHTYTPTEFQAHVN